MQSLCLLGILSLSINPIELSQELAGQIRVMNDQHIFVVGGIGVVAKIEGAEDDNLIVNNKDFVMQGIRVAILPHVELLLLHLRKFSMVGIGATRFKNSLHRYPRFSPVNDRLADSLVGKREGHKTNIVLGLMDQPNQLVSTAILRSKASFDQGVAQLK